MIGSLKISVWFFCCYLPAHLFRNFTGTKEKVDNGRYLADSVTTLAQLYVLDCDGARFLNQWHHALHSEVLDLIWFYILKA